MQHDMNVANQLFPATRADLNNAYESLATLQGGPAFPPTTFPNMLHFNETDDTLYMRTKADDGWLTLGRVLDGEWVPFVAGGPVDQGDTTTVGIWRGATGAEAAALTIDDAAVTPLALDSVIATEAFKGLVKLASIAEIQTGTEVTKAGTPRGLASLWRQGSNIAVASTLVKPADANLGGHYILTGSGTIAHLWSGEAAGKLVTLVVGATTTTFTNSGTLILPGNADFAGAVNDVLIFRAEAGNVWRCLNIAKRNGRAIVEPTLPEEGHTLQRLQDTYTLRTLLNDIPKDDSVPTTSDGTEILALTINMTASGNKCKIDVTVAMGGAGSDDCLIAVLFRDTTCIMVAAETCMSNSAIHNISFSYLDSPATAGNVTYRVRAGGNFANAYSNGNSSGRLFGGQSRCTLEVAEFKP